MRARLLILACLALALLCGRAQAGANDITEACRYRATVDAEHALRVTTDDYSVYWVGTGGELTVTLPAGKTAQGIQLSFFAEAVPTLVEALDSEGAVTGDMVYDGRYLNAYLPLPSAAAYSLRAAEKGAELRLNRVRVFDGDTWPRDAQQWREPEGPLDLLQIVTHPDDELIWFGGLLPTYAGEQKKNVLVAYAATHGALKFGRLNELLDGLWTCGVTSYPILGPFADFQAQSIKAVTKHWGEGAAQAWCARLIRQYRPKVVVTHDIRGESGHMQHQALARAAIDAVTEWSGNEVYDPDSAGEFGVFTPQKLYVHRYRKNEIFLDWEQPLSAFDGKTGAQVAREAFRKHVSQRNTHYTIFLSGPNDSRYLGLYFTTVGEDTEKNDVFEHVE